MPLLGEPSGVPIGAISVWTGSISTIPEGWIICDGTNGTPDLRVKFPKGVPNDSTDPGLTGGEDVVTLTEFQMPSHRHSFFVPNHEHSSQDNVQSTSGSLVTLPLTGSTFSGEFLADISSTFEIAGMTSTGGNNSHTNLPASEDVLYIMRS